MIKWFIILVPLIAFAQEDQKPWEDHIATEYGKFNIIVEPKKKKIEVKKIEGDQKSPPHVRVKILRKNNRPLELKLRTIDRLDRPLYYTGNLKQWNDSYMGLEVDFSFDKKTWKNLGKVIKKVVP